MPINDPVVPIAPVVPVDGIDSASRTLFARLDTESRQRLVTVPVADRTGFVSSDFQAVHTALGRVLDRELARGRVFCEWGSGLGGVCAVASALGFETHGIEIQPGLVVASRALLDDLDLDATIAQGSFLMPGDDDLLEGCEHTHGVTSAEGYTELGLDIADCDVVFAFPWPGEEHAYDRLFGRHATEGALLVTYHDLDRVLVQRHVGDPEELESLGWLGVA